MSNTPTPADIEALAQQHLKAFVQFSLGEVWFEGEVEFAHAVLAKWGTPAPVGVGEVAEHYRNAIASACEGWTMPDGLRKHLETALWSLPTQAQAGEAPLTDEQVKALMQAHRTAMLMTCKARVPECGEFAAIAQDLDWLCESFGIKGGQHG